jgi:hypothetical protein
VTVYLAPEQPRWQPSTESEIASVIEQGLLRETHYFNGKRQLDSTSADRKELARDLASFAMDGGALLIGVEELKQDRTWRLAPQPLDGLAERVEQVATQLIDPPLYVRSYEIGATDTTGGYLFVEVPSARAPHMVVGI